MHTAWSFDGTAAEDDEPSDSGTMPWQSAATVPPPPPPDPLPASGVPASGVGPPASGPPVSGLPASGAPRVRRRRELRPTIPHRVNPHPAIQHRVNRHPAIRHRELCRRPVKACRRPRPARLLPRIRWKNRNPKRMPSRGQWRPLLPEWGARQDAGHETGRRRQSIGWLLDGCPQPRTTRPTPRERMSAFRRGR